MIPSAYYHLVYLVFVTLLSFVTLYRYGTYSSMRLRYANRRRNDWSLLVVVVLVLYIGYRDPFAVAFQDTQAYSRWYTKALGDPFVWDWTQRDILFTNTMLLMSSMRIPIEFFYILIALLYFGGTWWSCSKLFPNDTLTTFVVWMAAFSTYSYGVNGLRAGVAMSFFLMAIVMLKEKKKLWMILFLLISLEFHHSMLMPIVAFIICCFFKNPKYYMVFWIICFLMAALHISYFQKLFVSIGEDIDDKVVGYLTGEGNAFMTQKMGFRIDFILYSFMPILLGWIAIFKKNIKSKTYLFLLNLYTVINGVWLLCIYAMFTNRIAYLSWGMYPIVLVYPLLKENWGKRQYKTFKWVAYGHLAFLLFMNFIYY